MKPHSRRAGDQRGAALLETAFVMLPFLAIVFFIFEMGLLFRASLTTENGSREAARAASTLGDDPEADFYILRSVEKGIQAIDPAQTLEYVVVYRATGPNDPLPAGCESGSVAGLCNHYDPAAFFTDMEDAAGNDLGTFRCGSLDSAWCPTTRETSLSAGTDYVGVHVQTRHNYVTGLLGVGTDLSETTIVRLEPDQD